MANLISVRLSKGDAGSWGFRLQGGKDFGTPLVVQKIIGGSPADRAGLIAGDTVVKINNVDVYNLRHKDAQDVILRAGPSFDIAVHRGGSTWKPAVTPVGSVSTPRPAAPINNISPVTSTSLHAGRQENIGAIGTSHNLSAKPFSAAVNGGPRLVNKQYNSPLPLYSEQSIAETLSAQSEVLSNGVLGVNFKKNEKSYDSANSAVFRMVQEADKEPRDYEPEAEPSSGVVTAPLGMAGLRHVQAPENKPQPATPQLPPGQNICAECERLIVGVFVRIKDKNLHVECFKCATCGTSLKNAGYYNLNNKLYCDVHAKLAARNNPPLPNLQPVTVPPGGRIPAGTISTALSSHSLPSPAPLSPSINYSATPYQPGGTSFSSPRPFSSVSAPLSPSSTLPKLSPTPSAPLTETRSFVQNIVWPPVPEQSEFPTASPLYFPPPSQVNLPQKEPPKELQTEQLEEQYDCELDEMSYISENFDRNMSLCSAEVSSITGRRSTVECTETISDTIDTQILVESILQSRPKSPPPTREPAVQTVPKPLLPADVDVSFTISEAELKRGAYENAACEKAKICDTTKICDATKTYDASKACQSKTCEMTKTCLRESQSQSLASMYEKKIKVENTVPHKWESPMVTALTVASDKPYSQTATAEPDPFSQIPPKTSKSGLASALATAPAQPFTPAAPLCAKPIPLPEETEPYFPPEHTFVIEPKQPKQEVEKADSSFVQALRTAPEKEFAPAGEAPVKKKERKRDSQDEFLKDLPKPPAEKISMRSALTTAPDRPYSPFSMHAAEYSSKEISESERKVEDLQQKQQVTKVIEKRIELPKPFVPKYIPSEQFTAPERLYSPFTTNKSAYGVNLTESKACSAVAVEQSKVESKKSAQEESSSEVSKSKNVQTKEDVTTKVISTESAGLSPIFQLVRASFESNTDRVQMQMSCDFPAVPITKTKVIETSTKDVVQQQSVDKSVSSKKAVKEEKRTAEEKSFKAASSEQTLQSAMFARNTMPSVQQPKLQEAKQLPAILPQQRKTRDVTGTALLQKAVFNAETVIKSSGSEERSQERMEFVKTSAPKEPTTIIRPSQGNLSVPEISFQPVSDGASSSSTFSPRPRPLTPSMINKPPPIIPPYQSSLVAMRQAPVGTNVYDPVSPAPSRSPSPYPGKPTSPFPSSAGRAVSPAPGPPPNPLQSPRTVTQLIEEGRKQTARSHVQSYIPHHQSAFPSKGQGLSQQQQTKFYAEGSACGTCQENVAQQQWVGGTSMVKSTTQQQQLLQEKAVSQQKSVRISDDSSVQVQRKKMVVEEHEHSRKSKLVQSSSSGTAQAVVENQGVVGFHLTNPQPLKSPFIASDESACNKTEVLAKLPTKLPTASKPTAPILTAPASIPSTSSGVSVTRPNVSQPNAGTGGGRQAGAIGVAPKRGRGILNLSATPGSRIPLCAQCHSNIRGPFITALGKIWCPDHFICATQSCRRALHDLGFVEERGQLYCEYCFEQYLAPPCAKCSAKVKGDCLKAIGKNFHPECFNCVYCGKLFGNSPFFLEDGQPYCDNDWNELFTTKCFACGFPVEAGDRWVEALNNNYHSQCFNCTMCKKNLEGQSFFAKGGRPFCKNHAR